MIGIYIHIMERGIKVEDSSRGEGDNKSQGDWLYK